MYYKEFHENSEYIEEKRFAWMFAEGSVCLFLKDAQISTSEQYNDQHRNTYKQLFQLQILVINSNENK